jgi:hypothetical protein
VSVFAVFDGVDVEGIVRLFGEADAVGADTLAELRRAAAMEFLQIARTMFGQAMNRRQDVHGDVLRDGADVGFGVVGETNPLQAGSLALRISSKPKSATTSSKEVPWLF